jgi:single-stranded-DNA-specific exonuclease
MDLRPAVRVDAEVALAELNGELALQLAQFEPCGYGNPAPVLAARGVRVSEARPVGGDNQHLKLAVTDGRVTLDAIAFNQGEWFGHLPARIDLAFTFETNEWNGSRRLQLNVKDLRAGE